MNASEQDGPERTPGSAQAVGAPAPDRVAITPAPDQEADQLPEEAWLAALVDLPAMWPSRLAALLGLQRVGHQSPAPRRSARRAWELLVTGEISTDRRVVRRCQPDPLAVVAGWRHAAQRTNPARAWDAYRSTGTRLLVLGDASYPAALAIDHAAPYLLVSLGDLAALERPRVAIVGTRRCTVSGRETAMQFGRELAEAGVCVVSGLALGIDGAAHTGALSIDGARPVAVVAGGLDRPYPTRHHALWRQVAAHGLLCSEAPLGTANEAWRFPARNRILAALADVVVVVESHSTGGSMITVEEALARGRCVMAVPGSVCSPASAGTNHLFREGAAPACDTADILTALALDGPARQRAPDEHLDARVPPSGEALAILEAVDWAATATETVLVRAGRDPSEVIKSLALLEMDGWVRGAGGWWERLK